MAGLANITAVVSMAGMGVGVMDHMELHNNVHTHKIYCQRAMVQHTDCLNTSALDCSVTFMVDKNIYVLGVQVILKLETI